MYSCNLEVGGACFPLPPLYLSHCCGLLVSLHTEHCNLLGAHVAITIHWQLLLHSGTAYFNSDLAQGSKYTLFWFQIRASNSFVYGNWTEPLLLQLGTKTWFNIGMQQVCICWYIYDIII